MKIDQTNTRRFAVIGAAVPAVLAIFDTRKGFNIYAEVVAGNRFDVSTARSYFNDEIEELR